MIWLLSGKVLLNKVAVGATKIIDAVGQVFTNIYLPVRICNFVYHFHILVTHDTVACRCEVQPPVV